ISSLCLNGVGDRIAVTDKGRTAAELMVFARYVMFSEVYWHHAVRSATAMLQRAVYHLEHHLDWPRLFVSTDQDFASLLLASAGREPAGALIGALFGSER